ncbi:TauD/TfdA family dioxygenase [Halomonas sp. HNIBRBA4712]|uniref:TauD/TfdA family dioxygenase n=1 Tax=Halomonas sp. HNIBRBA4712 TaxID=3373087 RepID=UPI00374552F9
MNIAVSPASRLQAPDMNELTPYDQGLPLASAKTEGEAITLGWENGDKATLAFIWLRDHCACPQCRHPQTRERLLTPLSEVSAPKAVTLANGHLYIEWADGHASAFHSGWLHQRRPGAQAGSPLPEPRAWRDAFTPTRVRHAEFLTLPGEREWLDAVLRDGLALVTDAPLEEEEITRLAARIGPSRATNFGDRFDVRSQPNPNNAAYTAVGLALHIDLPNWRQPPDIQLLYCLENDASGGGSLFADGLRVVEALRREDPQALSILSRTPIDFRFQDEYHDIRTRVPVIQLDEAGEVIDIRLNNWIRDALDLPSNEMAAWYRAYRLLWTLFHSEAHQLEFDLLPGQMVAFDNRRVLHGRRAFDPESGARHLQGLYLDRDLLVSRRRVLDREPAF